MSVCIAAEEVVASIAGRDAVKTDAEELIRWCLQTTDEPAQKPPPAPRPFDMDPNRMSISVA